MIYIERYRREVCDGTGFGARRNNSRRRGGRGVPVHPRIIGWRRHNHHQPTGSFASLGSRVPAKERRLVTRYLKSLLGFLAFRLGLHRALLSKRAIVVLFQPRRRPMRVGRDHIAPWRNSTVSARSFAVTSWSISAKPVRGTELRRGEDISRHLAITFDDRLSRQSRCSRPAIGKDAGASQRGVSSRRISWGGRGTPWWDREAGIESEWMTWDQVRALTAQGFDVGAHTCNHVDLGLIAGSDARREIADPFFLSAEMAAAWVCSAIRTVESTRSPKTTGSSSATPGTTADCPAYGGNVTKGASLYDLRRIRTQWHLTAYQFGFEAIRGRLWTA